MINIIKAWIKKIKIKKQNKIIGKRRDAFVKEVRNAYVFLKGIEHQLPNRQMKKQFYRDLLHRGMVHNRYIDLLAGAMIKESQLDKVLKEKEKRETEKAGYNSPPKNDKRPADTEPTPAPTPEEKKK